MNTWVIHLNRSFTTLASKSGCGALEAAGVDGEVYGGYISGSLAAMEGSAREEIEETVEEILSGCAWCVVNRSCITFLYRV